MRIAGIASLTLVFVLTATAGAQPSIAHRSTQTLKALDEAESTRPRSAFESSPSESGRGPTAFSDSSLARNAFRPCPGEYCSSGFYGRAEYLLWWFNRDFDGAPPLVTTGNPANTPTGALGQPGTRVLFGGDADRGSSDPFSGGRFTLGYWFGDIDVGLEVSGFAFWQRDNTPFSASNSGTPGSGSLNLAFFNNDGRFEDAINVGLDGVQSGGIRIDQEQQLWGAEMNVPWLVSVKDRLHFSLLAGFRYLNLEESFELRAHATALPVDQGIRTNLFESHAARNNFYGGQIGARTDFFGKDWRVTFLSKFALGGTDQNVRVEGVTTNIDPINGRVVAPGGLYAGPNNIGNHTRCRFGTVSEFGVNLGYNCTENLTINAGYTFLYLSDVVRPGEQIDRAVNFQVNDRPRTLFTESDFWANGISVGAVFRY